MDYDRAILVALGDTHAGHKLGLMNPETLLIREAEDGRQVLHCPVLTESQQYLWEIYTEDVENVQKLAAGDPIITAHMGDETQGKFHFEELVSTRQWDQYRIAAWNMKPWFALPNLAAVRLVIGTGVHGFGEGTATLTVADYLGLEFSNISIMPLYHGLAEILGVTVDYAHHGPYTGSRNWLKGNVAWYYLKSAVNDDIDLGNVPPHLYIRAHYHEYVQVYFRKNSYQSWLTVIPSYCLLPDYARRKTASTFIIKNGLVAYEIINGRIVEIHPFLHTLDIRTKEKIL